MSQSPYVSAATAADFNEKVIQRSRQVPVLVDFWAAWCGPCRSLTPVLHQIVDDLKGAVLLVTVDTDREIDLARQYQIRSLPTVKLFQEGRIIDEFMGALPASHVRRFLEPYVMRESDRQADKAAQLARQGKFAEAQGLFRQAIDKDPDNVRVRVRFAASAIEAGKLDLATEVLNAAPAQVSQDKGIVRLKALIDFHKLVDPALSDAQLESITTESSPPPAALRDLAARKVLKGDYAGAMDIQLRLMQSHRTWSDNAAQKDMLAVFALANDPELVGSYRRRMYTLLH
ncbi:MAG: tetratricopeptide repeat protein [Arenicellales bacterium]